MRLADVVEVLEVDKQLEPRAAETRAGLEEGWRQSEYFWTQVRSCIVLPCQSASHSLTHCEYVLHKVCQSCDMDLSKLLQ